MKKILSFCICTLVAMSSFSQVGIGTNTPDSNSVLDITSTNKGVLFPRVSLSATNSSSPLSAHIAGMMVYNTATAGTSPNNVTPGYYFNNGSKWIKTLGSGDIDLLDATNDAFVNDSNNKVVKLGTQSNGRTARPASSAFIIRDTGTVGIGIASPLTTTKLNVIGKTIISGSANPTSPLSSSWHDVGAPTGILEQTTLRLVNTSVAATGNKAMLGFNSYDGDGSVWAIGSQQNNGTMANSNFHIFYSGTGSISTAYTRPLTIAPGTGNVGLNNTIPVSPLHFRNDTIGRKITLYGGISSIHQQYGFSMGTNQLEYRVNDSASSSHVFLSGLSSSSSKELLRIKGNGNVGIATASPSTMLHVNGSMATNITAINATTTLGDNNCYIVANTGTYTITLPSAGTCNGRMYFIKTVGTGTKTISSFLNLSGTATTTLANNSSITLISDGTNWQQF